MLKNLRLIVYKILKKFQKIANYFNREITSKVFKLMYRLARHIKYLQSSSVHPYSYYGRYHENWKGGKFYTVTLKHKAKVH